MKNLSKLGVTVKYESNNERLVYTISVDRSKFSDPRKKDKYFRKVVDAISADAEKKGRLENLTVVADPRDIPILKETTKSRLVESQNDKNTLYNWRHKDNCLVLNSALVYGGAVVGGVAGVALTYPIVAEWGLKAAEYVNNNLPNNFGFLPRLAQAGVSIVPTAIGTAVGLIGGMFAGKISSFFYYFPINEGHKVKRYEALDRILSDEEIDKVESEVDSRNIGELLL